MIRLNISKVENIKGLCAYILNIHIAPRGLRTLKGLVCTYILNMHIAPFHSQQSIYDKEHSRSDPKRFDI